MQDRRPDRALVIGGTLFIGRALVRRLLARGDDVTILHRGTKQPFAGQAAEILCDRNDTADIAQKLNGVRFDVVYDNVYDWQRGTTAEQVKAAALAAAPGLRRYVFTSSVAAYGGGLNLSEDHPLAPEDHPEDYVRNKAQTERMLFRLHEDEGLPAATLRPPYVYGPENPFYREAFFWDRLLAGRPILLPDDGERLMQFVLADDLARAAILAADTDVSAGRAYNIAHESAITQRALVKALADAADRRADLVPVPRERLIEFGGNIFEPPFYFAQYFDMPPITQNTARAGQELGFEPTSWQKGLLRTFECYLSRERPAADFSFDDKVLSAFS
ncbi:MAG: NAD-dependent epimerase/dehydratase family protein [Bryobacterales bacterium]|nr:NAD-dependent epimerase/dehydratase family protein [Bryobacterales bacterium]